jgi:predicted Zn-dependent protease
MKTVSKFKTSLIVAGGITLSAFSSVSLAQEPPVLCAGYERPKTQLLGERVGKKLNAAFDAYNEDRVEEAITLLREIEAKEEFDQASVDKFLGQLLASQDGKSQESLTFLARAVEKKILNDGDYASITKAVGDLSLNEEKYEDALKYYQRWMDFTCKEDANVYLRMAKAYLDLKQYDKVIGPADNAIRTFEKPNKNAYALKVSAYYESKKIPEAIDVVETVVQLFPDDKTWWNRLGMFYLLEERYDDALSVFELSYKQGFLTTKSQINTLAQLYSSQDVPFKAAEIQAKYVKSGLLDSDEKTLANVAALYARSKNFKQAADYYGRAAKIENNAEYLSKKGEMLLTAEDYKGAITALEAALAQNVEKEGRVSYSLMEAYFYTGDFRKAFEYNQKAKSDRTIRRNALAWEPYIKEKAKNRGIRI